ncbi:uncharacterized protein LOC121615401 isoform X2 [Xyrichtys novacula]|uniref:Uncharacterized protein LOC121615401 isoform X2 n=1 Tax=Xyrichtys novacula TaxID=13765 RepID=A0AAV1GGE1_XYRNO|nr:uncharacterized protein LOC121615401 isoform X2 [Xyrichtys novacula]
MWIILTFIRHTHLHLSVFTPPPLPAQLYHWDALVFGKAIRLTVHPKDRTPVPPALFVLNPLQPEGVPLDRVGDQVCLAAGFRPQDGEMDLNEKDGQVSMNTTSAPMSTKDGTHSYVGFSNKTLLSCELHGASANNYHVERCADHHPEKAKLSFHMLVLNGVRVVFTKTLAFSTLFTIRAVLI